MPAWIEADERVVVRHNGMILVLNNTQYQEWDFGNTIFDGPLSVEDANALAKELGDALVHGRVVEYEKAFS